MTEEERTHILDLLGDARQALMDDNRAHYGGPIYCPLVAAIEQIQEMAVRTETAQDALRLDSARSSGSAGDFGRGAVPVDFSAGTAISGPAAGGEERGRSAMLPDDYLAKWRPRVDPRAWEEFERDFRSVLEGQRGIADRALKRIDAIHAAADDVRHYVASLAAPGEGDPR